MTIPMVLWFVAGTAAGSGHAWMLWRASQTSSGTVWPLIRICVIGGVLVAAALSGAILPAAAGWAVAYFSSVGAVALRKPA